MRINPKSESEAREAARRVLLKAGWYDARIADAAEKPSKAGKDVAVRPAALFLDAGLHPHVMAGEQVAGNFSRVILGQRIHGVIEDYAARNAASGVVHLRSAG